MRENRVSKWRIDRPNRFRGPKTSHQISDRILILAHRETSQFDSGRLRSLPRGLRVEGLKYIRGDVLRLLFAAFLRRVLGHLLGDETRELRDGFISRQRIGVLFVRPFPRRSVAFGAALAIDLLALAAIVGKSR